MTLEALAAKLEMSTSHLSRLESGRRTLSTDVAAEIAAALGVGVADILGIDTSHSFAEDADPYVPEEGDHLANLGTTTNHSLYLVKTNVLDELNIRSGDVVVIDIGATAVAGVKPLDVVIAQNYDSRKLTKSTTLMRQFVPPQLLITNSIKDNRQPVNMAATDTHIKGIVVSWHRHLRKRK